MSGVTVRFFHGSDVVAVFASTIYANDERVTSGIVCVLSPAYELNATSGNHTTTTNAHSAPLERWLQSPTVHSTISNHLTLPDHISGNTRPIFTELFMPVS